MSRVLPPIMWFAMLAIIAASGFLTEGPVLLPDPYPLAGWGVFVLGGAVTVIASRQFAAIRTNINTFRDPERLVTGGLFAVSRNPMYLGFAVSLAGAALGVNRALALLPVAAFFAAAHFHYIPFEERAAARVFGDAYAAYRRRVRRWI